MNLLSDVLPWAQIILSILLIVVILLQRTEAGLGAGFGGSGESFIHTRRGFEKTILLTTIILGILFTASAIITLFI